MAVESSEAQRVKAIRKARVARRRAVLLLAAACVVCGIVVAFFQMHAVHEADEQASLSRDQEGIEVSSDATPTHQEAEAMASAERKTKEREAARKADADAKAKDFSKKATGRVLEKVPGDNELVTFSLNEGRAKPKLKKKRAAAISAAIREVVDAKFDCGVAFVDLESGQGIAYNAGKPIYTASAFKAPFVFYMLQHDGGISDEDRASAEASIRSSSNDDYDDITMPRMGQDYIDWQESYGIEFDGYTPYYSYASARTMARIWADIYQYLQSDAKEAKWFADVLAGTNQSFIRDGLEGQKVTVRNKAGWISEEYDATTDAGYIDADGRPYLMVILTNQPNGGTAFDRVSAIAKNLFAARSSLE